MNYLATSNSAGQHLRMRRIFNKSTGRSLIIPLDHGITFGPIPGLIDVTRVITDAEKGGADAIMLRPGLINAVLEADATNLGIILCLTGRFDRGVDHVELNSVEYAAKCGADAVCVEFKLGSDGDLENARFASKLAETAHNLGLPVLMTIYALPEYVQKMGSFAYAHACRIGEELGADFIKTSLPSDMNIVEECLKSVRVPLIVAGGNHYNSNELIDNVESMIEMGISGAAIGRNVWGNENPQQMIHKLSSVIHSK